jgi:hypothetical protein
MVVFPQPRFMPCTECGASVPRSQANGHVCESERKLDYELFQLRHELDAFEAELTRFLVSPSGRFALWYAERERRQSR